MLDRIQQELTSALLKKDETRVSVLRMLVSAIHNFEIEQRSKDAGKLSDEDVLGVLRKELKKRKESAELYTQGNRPELTEQEQQEAKIIEEFLPAAPSDEEIERIVKEVFISLDNPTEKDFGVIMKEVMKRTQGRAEGGAVSSVVKKLLHGDS